MHDFLESVSWDAGDPAIDLIHGPNLADEVTTIIAAPRTPGDYSSMNISITAGAVTTEIVEIPLGEIERLAKFFDKLARWAKS
jgi:hypothetical protein